MLLNYHVVASAHSLYEFVALRMDRVVSNVYMVPTLLEALHVLYTTFDTGRRHPLCEYTFFG